MITTKHRFKPGQRVVVRGGEVFTIQQLTQDAYGRPAYYMLEQDGKFSDSDLQSADFLNKYRYEPTEPAL